MTEIDDSINGNENYQKNGEGKKKRGRPPKLPKGRTQHSVFIEDPLWDAMEELPVSRQTIFRQAVIDAIAYYNSDLVKLKEELRLVRNDISELQSKETFLLALIEEQEAARLSKKLETTKEAQKKEEAVSVMLQLCRSFGKRMSIEHFSRIAEFSSIEPAKIHAFLQDKRFRPKEEDARAFILGDEYVN